jgi:hypothetical protein
VASLMTFDSSGFWMLMNVLMGLRGIEKNDDGILAYFYCYKMKVSVLKKYVIFK